MKIKLLKLSLNANVLNTRNSPAIHWGQYNEDKAIEAFFKCKRSKHKKLKINYINYMCHVCHKECIDKPVNINDMSVCCDLCKDWFHWVCVGLKGTETVWKRCQLKWKCPFCTE